MKNITLTAFLEQANEYWTKEKANYLLVWVSINGGTPEIIINYRENFESKLNYYQQAYNEDLTLKANSNIRIIHFDFVEEVDLTIYE